MNTYANVLNNVVVEIIEPFVSEGGAYVPIEFRYAPEFVVSLVDITNTNPKPEQGDIYLDGMFSKPKTSQPVASKAELEINRLIAYADAIYGSDRHFLEVVSLQAEGFAANSPEVKEAKAKGLARKAEIQALYPYPV